jgi:hypothetical protein
MKLINPSIAVTFAAMSLIGWPGIAGNAEADPSSSAIRTAASKTSSATTITRKTSTSRLLTGIVEHDTNRVERRISVKTPDGEVRRIDVPKGINIIDSTSLSHLSVHELDDGDYVRVLAQPSGPGRWRADRIHLLVRDEHLSSTMKATPQRLGAATPRTSTARTVFSGKVEHDTNRVERRISLKVNDNDIRRIDVPKETVIIDLTSGSRISVHEIDDGDLLEVRGYLESPGRWRATRIYITGRD